MVFGGCVMDSLHVSVTSAIFAAAIMAYSFFQAYG
jgi:hypothetical protein